MEDDERFKLLNGPYTSLQVKVGDALTDEKGRQVVIEGWSAGRIPWPVATTYGRVSLILTGELSTAVQIESSQAIQHWWGVSASTVYRWRKTLGCAQYNAGTRRLHRECMVENLPVVMAQRQGAGLAAHAQRSAMLRARGFYHHSQRVWTKDDEARLGTMPDAVLAEQLGRPVRAVSGQRYRLGIPAFGRRQSPAVSESRLRLDAKKVTQRRLVLGLSQKVVAQRAGLEVAALGQVEAGTGRRLKSPAGERLAHALECKLADLL